MNAVKRTKLADRLLPNYTKSEEIVNMVSHIVGGALGVVALVTCVITAVMHKSVYGIVSGACFGATMVLLYTMSSIYHGLNKECFAKRVFQVIDHCTIFFLISGTYTPLMLCALRSVYTALAWTIFGIVWAAAILGAVLNAVDLKKYSVFSMICYLGMGWCIVITMPKIVPILGAGGAWLLMAGGIAYTIGAVLYVVGKKHRYAHSIFHLFVVAGSLLHYFCILLYVL